MKITPVILCGGSGTRLWPLSRKSYPKQFSPFIGEHSLFQTCAKRLNSEAFTAPVIVTGDPFRFIVLQQLQDVCIEPDTVLIEPVGRDTAPAIIAAALQVAESDPDALLLVAPADHLIPDEAAFRDSIEVAIPAGRAGQLVTFGIKPDHAETGYGYLELDPMTQGCTAPVPLRRFIEKPDADAAVKMLLSGHYLWNAGIFLFTAKAIIDAYRTHASNTYACVKAALDEGMTDLSFMRLAPGPWAEADATSIDYAIMEKATNLSVVPYHGTWSDLGDWAAVWRETQADGVATAGDTTAIDCQRVLLRSEVEGQSLVGIGLEDIVAVAMPDAVLISHKDRAQDVKLAVRTLQENGTKQAEVFPKDHRPWGWFESLAMGDRFQVKRIVVNPGAALSLQSHHHRSEHWIVVQGTANVTVGNKMDLVTENQSIYIPLGTRHRLENPGKLPMVLIEVQTGAYLGEDDIVRHEDMYARA
ncbi:mannose-1-phosphate guanylyltransferase/mannose-1-phosphate guanylyltransferase/mannose-6-phosphate isomerase [Yoonia maricola]|uniref:mannose-1-phosphate guanylyltransferase n=1 Tax=Yoonia maricola TaxID=420999 RepID=A0A2M8W0Z8_9RHOB|nr:mannose-1-phosphate guanylyltransferase/mannose-6-phosphate isomerase [Yoonia maricola]PJI84601.1 mannose-1-phosphate guanylyltransferase/mannose-1-phosphate guanylyltransferase/mannose-6-phosphate isomerase [Yoonia maricola]